MPNGGFISIRRILIHLINLVSQSLTFIWDCTVTNLSSVFHTLIYGSEGENSMKLWEEEAEEFATLTLRQFEDAKERALCITAFDEYSRMAFKALLREKKKVGAKTKCYVFKIIQETSVVQAVKIPTPISVKKVLEFFNSSSHNSF